MRRKLTMQLEHEYTGFSTASPLEAWVRELRSNKHDQPFPFDTYEAKVSHYTGLELGKRRVLEFKDSDQHLYHTK